MTAADDSEGEKVEKARYYEKSSASYHCNARNRGENRTFYPHKAFDFPLNATPVDIDADSDLETSMFQPGIHQFDHTSAHCAF